MINQTQEAGVYGVMVQAAQRPPRVSRDALGVYLDGPGGPVFVGHEAVRDVGRAVVTHGPCRAQTVIDITQLPDSTVAVALRAAIATNWIEQVDADLYDRV